LQLQGGGVPVVPVDDPPLQPEAAVPSTPALFPQTFTGTLIGTEIWLPPPIELSPEVADHPPPEPPSTEAPPWQPPKASPRMASAFPQTFTGIDTGTLIWLPPRMLLLPLVVPAMATAEPDAAKATVSTATLAVRLSERDVIIFRPEFLSCCVRDGRFDAATGTPCGH